jgi:histidinol-phosphate aminotransferase
LDRVKNSFNSYTLDRLALAGAVEAIKHEEYFQETRQKVINTRERFSAALIDMGFEVVDSKANFVFISHGRISANIIFKELREKGILVRHFNKPRIDNYLRISIGTDKEMDTVLLALKEILNLI